MGWCLSEYPRSKAGCAQGFELPVVFLLLERVQQHNPLRHSLPRKAHNKLISGEVSMMNS
jgi:hypothetical protein